MHICTYTHTHIHTYAHTHIRTHAQATYLVILVQHVVHRSIHLIPNLLEMLDVAGGQLEIRTYFFVVVLVVRHIADGDVEDRLLGLKIGRGDCGS
jgi:hypothetical protein